MYIVEYVGKMCSLADEMMFSDKPLDDKELISYILTDLDFEYNPIVSALVTGAYVISVGEVYSQLLSFEYRMELLHGDSQHSANVANRGRGGQRGYGGGHGHGDNYQGRARTPVAPTTIKAAPTTTSLGVNCASRKDMRYVIDCWYRFEEDFVPNKKYAGSATTSYGVDMNWYIDSGASDHVTGDLKKLSVRGKYKGQDQVHTASRAGISISHIGHSVV